MKASIMDMIGRYQLIYDKKKANIPLTDEEKEIYDKYNKIVIQEDKPKKEK